MSHKSEISTTLTNQKYLLEALKNLGFTYKVAEEGKKIKTKGKYNVHESVDIVVTGNGNIDYQEAIGFKKENDGTYKAVGDFWSLRTKDGRAVTREMLKCEVTAHSKEVEVNHRLRKLGFKLNKNSRKETNDQITFTMERYI